MLPDWFGQVRDPVLELMGTSGVTGELLRQWGSSQVWRIRSGSGSSVIVKRAIHRMRHEGAVYTDLIQPLGLPAPGLLHRQDSAGATVLVLSDVGVVTLEQRPSLDGYRQAVSLLARIRVRNPAGVIPARTPADFTDLVPRCNHGLRAARPDLPELPDAVFKHIDQLYDDVPATVVHGDFVPKNLVHGPEGLVAIDWPSACISPHLGDLYSLVHEAGDVPVGKAEALAWYAEERQRLGFPIEDSLSWQYDLGGLLWTLEAICWIVEEGRHTVPGSLDWLDGLVGDMSKLLVGLST